MDPSTAALAEALTRLRLENRTVEILSVIAGHIHDAVAILDEQGRVEWANEAFIQGAARNPEPLARRSMAFELTGSLATPETTRAIHAALASHRTVTGKNQKHLPDGSTSWTRFHLSPLVDDTGGSSRFILIEVDAPLSPPAVSKAGRPERPSTPRRSPTARVFQDPTAAQDIARADPTGTPVMAPAPPVPTNGDPDCLATRDAPPPATTTRSTPEPTLTRARGEADTAPLWGGFPPASGAPFLNLDAAISRLEGNVNLLEDLIRFFLDDHEDLMGEIERAVRDHAVDDLARSAHRLKDLVANFDATATAQAAFSLETMARSCDLTQADVPLKTLREQVPAVRQALLEYLRKSSRP